MSDKSVWATLSAIDCNEHVEKKGQFSYLAWTWAWAMVKEQYPESVYRLHPDTTYPDGTMEVRVEVMIKDGEKELSHLMWLPVLDHKNKPIANPNAFDINTARMRCLVKACAMHGLGHYIFSGESAPADPGLSDEEFERFLAYLAEKDGLGLLRYMAELGEERCNEAYNRAPKGHKVKFKDSVKAVQQEGLAVIDQYVEDLMTHVECNDEAGVMELIAEIQDDSWLKAQVWGRLSDITKHQIKSIMGGKAA